MFTFLICLTFLFPKFVSNFFPVVLIFTESTYSVYATMKRKRKSYDKAGRGWRGEGLGLADLTLSIL